LRRHGHRYASEQANILEWIRTVQACAGVSYEFGLEAAATARLIKGYSGTYRRGLASFEHLMRSIVAPAIDRNEDASVKLRSAVEAALTHSGATIEKPAQGFKPIAFVRNSAKSGLGTSKSPTAHEAASTAGSF
jgi:indolepyruvate ferredoxin oxidoreductase beta subunit